MAQKTTHKGLSNSGKASPITGSMTMAEVSVKVPQSARQEYSEVNAAIDRGLADVAAGRVHTRRSYAEYADIELEN